jgi:SnoaL-like domain
MRTALCPPMVEMDWPLDRGRVTMLFRRTQAGWRAIHFHESALAVQAADQINRMRNIGKEQDSQSSKP